MAKLIDSNYTNPQKSNGVNFKQLNTNDYALSKIQQNVQESFSKVTELLNNFNICFYEQNYTKTIPLNTFFSFSSQINDSFGVYAADTGIFKAPKTGTYFLTCIMYLTITASQLSSITLYKNGVVYMLVWSGENTATLIQPQFNICLNLKAGDEIKLFWSSSDVNPVGFGNSSLIENQLVIRW